MNNCLMYIVYRTIDENEYHYVGEFTEKDAAIEFASSQETKCVVAEHRSFCDSPIIYKNY